MADPEFNPMDPEWGANARMRVAEIEEHVRSKSTAEWADIFTANGVPNGALNFPEDMVDDPQVVANDGIVALEHDLSGHVGGMEFNLKGRIANLQELDAPDLHFEVDGPDLAELMQTLGLPAPQPGRFHLEGEAHPVTGDVAIAIEVEMRELRGAMRGTVDALLDREGRRESNERVLLAKVGERDPIELIDETSERSALRGSLLIHMQPFQRSGGRTSRTPWLPVALPEAPSSSVTVSVTVYIPGLSYV